MWGNPPQVKGTPEAPNASPHRKPSTGTTHFPLQRNPLATMPAPYPRRCRNCGREFSAKVASRRHCTPACAYAFKLQLRFARARARTAGRGPVSRDCVICGRQFDTPRVGTGRGACCCSPACFKQRRAARSAVQWVRKLASRVPVLCQICGNPLANRRGGRKTHPGQCTEAARERYTATYREAQLVERHRQRVRQLAK